MSIVQNIKNFVSTSLTFSAETHEKIRGTIRKTIEFIIENKSLIFFGLTVLFSFYAAPASAFEYLSYFDICLKDVFIEGALFGSTLLILKNLFAAKSTKTQDDKINYLAGLANIGQTYLSPTHGLVGSVAIAGFITLKSTFQYLFPSDDREIYFLVDNGAKKV